MTLLALLFVFLLTLSVAQDCDGAQSPPDLQFGVKLGDEPIERALAMARDLHGHVYVTGYSGVGSGSPGTDIVTCKYDSEGNELWSHRWDGPAELDDQGTGIAVDAMQNIYVCGWVRATSTDLNFVARKYGKDPEQHAYAVSWTRTINLGTGDEQARAIALDSFGNVYVAGSLKRSTLDAVIVKLDGDDGDLSEDWPEVPASGQAFEGMRFFNGTTGDQDRFNAISIDGAGGVVATGRVDFETSPNPTGFDMATMRVIRSDGEVAYDVVWTPNSSSSQQDEGLAVATDSAGYAYVTGQTGDLTLTSGRAATLKYNPQGNLCWTHVDLPSEDPPGEDAEWRSSGGRSIAFDAKGFVYVCGIAYSDVTQEAPYVYTIKLAKNATNEVCNGTTVIQHEEAWDRTFPGTVVGESLNSGISVDYDLYSNIYVGAVLGATQSTGPDFLVLRYDPCGRLIWEKTYNYQSTHDDTPSKIIVSKTEPIHMWLTGSTVASTWSQYMTVHYCWRSGDVNDDGVIDDTDLAIVLGCYGANPSGCRTTDINNDGQVDEDDLTIVIENYGQNRNCP